jgi:hypothetical protein
MKASVETLVLAPKSFATAPRWTTRSDDDWVNLVAPLDIEGVTVEGLRFRGKAHRFRPEMQVTFRLEIMFGASVEPLVRLDWRPTAKHRNPANAPQPYRLASIEGSHLHPFDLNWRGDKPVGVNLPVAIPLPQEESYDDLLARVGQAFNVGPMAGFPRPDWTEVLV